ncbi:MAG: hypothetical protein IJT87_05885 [Ruminiclostridium sp.]|nr:hypothetical protein [Ruminiclostridium sp.]
MNDGVYSIAITMTGGTGKAYISSPVTLTVTTGEMTAKMEWSSPNYDLMIVDGKEFLPVNTDGNSVFEIPVYTLDEPLSVQAETVAMSEPHLIDYVITFDKSSLPAENGLNVPLIVGGSAVGAVVIVGAVIAVVRSRKKKA